MTRAEIDEIWANLPPKENEEKRSNGENKREGQALAGQEKSLAY
jgi:hypothetical protein